MQAVTKYNWIHGENIPGTPLAVMVGEQEHKRRFLIFTWILKLPMALSRLEITYRAYLFVLFLESYSGEVFR